MSKLTLIKVKQERASWELTLISGPTSGDSLSTLYLFCHSQGFHITKVTTVGDTFQAHLNETNSTLTDIVKLVNLKINA
jgi:hypothetical protein